MLTFLRDNFRWLGTGLLLTFASSFGQTWFISLFAGEIKLEFSLTDGSWGQLYTVATLSSAALMFWSGSLVDRIPLSRFAPAITFLFAIAAVGFGLSTSVWMLGFFIFLLRYCGQGMFSHIAMTAMGRWFDAMRGRAVSISTMGHPIGEVVIPLIAVTGIAVIGWQATWIGVALILAIIVAPLLFFLLRDNRSPHGKGKEISATGLENRHWTRAQAVRHWLLLALIPMLLTPGFIATVLFFHQTHIADIKGWSLLEMAAGYSFFASATIFAVFITGWAADHFGAVRLLPYILVSMGLGMFLIGMGSSIWIWYGTLALCGITLGASSAFWGVFLPVAYGTKHLGSIRSLATTIMVISTAIGPGITGLLIDAGVTFTTQGFFMGLWCLTFSLLGVIITTRMKREG